MNTLVDYIRWLGNIDFSARPVSDADAVILSILAYCDLTQLFREHDEIYVRDIKKLIERDQLKIMIVGKDTGAAKVVETAAASSRFGNLKITNYTDILQNDPPLQFAAMTIRDGKRFAFVAYRGTDSSLAGWKENIMLSFTKTKTQEMALEYAENVIEYGPEWYIVGHSKGGNSALYAASLLSEEKWQCVNHVYLLDGPGFCPEVLDTGLIERVNEKASRIIPDYCVVGKIFEPAITDTKIVSSDQQLVMQHAQNSWLLDYGEFHTLAKNDENSLWVNSLMKGWIEELPLAERPLMTEELFEAFESTGAKDLGDLNPERIYDALLSLQKISDTTKKNLFTLPKLAFFDDVDPEIPKGSFLDRIKSSYLLLGILLVVLGVGIFFISDKILEISSLLLVASAAVFQLVLLIRKLIKCKGKFDGLQERIIITIVLFALVIVLLVKEQAMFFLGSMIFSVLFFILAYYTGRRALKKEESRFIRVLSVIESFLSLVYGFSFLLIPSATVKTYAVSISIVLAADGLARLIYLFVRWLVRRKRQKTA
ncbi:MAG: DUF2974 domain-containing protein [Lachnospiraceae bacterium]|nr:DUF2974 domain-containing protein [Lachnospiraceae bacterium]